MSVQRIYFGLTESVLLTMRTDVLAELTKLRTGKQHTSLGAGGKNMSKSRMTLAQLYAELSEITAALQNLDPDTYGKRVTKTYAMFDLQQDL